MQLYQWYLVLVLLSSSSLMLTQHTASYSFIHLHSCPICEAQYDYDFTTAVQLALDNLSNGSSLGKNYRTVGEGSHNIMEPDRVLPTIQPIPLQVRLNISI